jgi:hypothetical protein
LQVEVAQLREQLAQEVVGKKGIQESAAAATMSLESCRIDFGLCRDELARGMAEIKVLRLDLGRSRESETRHAQSAQRRWEALDAVRRVVHSAVVSTSVAHCL